MHVILASAGTAGDIYPYLAVGSALRARGHRVSVVVDEPFRAATLARGLEFHPFVSEAESNELLDQADFWHPLKGPWIGSRWGVRYLERQYELFANLARDDDVVLAASPAIFAARLVRDTLNRPLASIVLQPWLIRSITAPPVMPGRLSLPRGMPRPVGELYWRLVDGAGDLLIGREVNRLCKKLGLDPVRRVFHWWYSPDLMLGLFPDWFGPPQADWPPRTHLTGFPLDDGDPDAELPADVRAFLEVGPPPVAITFGTGMRHAHALFRTALDACHERRLRALVLTRHRDQLPAELPPSCLACGYAPFGKLFPRCAAVIHHGGIGTIAKAMAAATPQLVIPIAYDQIDNATRVRALGAGYWVKPARQGQRRLAAALARLVTDDARARCAPLARRFAGQDAIGCAADHIEELARTLGKKTPAPLGDTAPAPRRG